MHAHESVCGGACMCVCVCVVSRAPLPPGGHTQLVLALARASLRIYACILDETPLSLGDTSLVHPSSRSLAPPSAYTHAY